VVDELVDRVRSEPKVADKLCRGTMLSWDQYLPDVKERGYADARLHPHGTLTKAEVDEWTASDK
jgi:hypothetical protein